MTASKSLSVSTTPFAIFSPSYHDFVFQSILLVHLKKSLGKNHLFELILLPISVVIGLIRRHRELNAINLLVSSNDGRFMVHVNL